MITIDPRTVILLAGVMGAFMAAIMYALKHSYPPAIKGLGEWALALSLISVGGVLGFWVGFLPDVLSVTLPRLLFPSGLLLAYVGTQRFFGQTPRIWPWAVLIAGVVLAQMWFTFVERSFHMRLVLSGSLGVCLLMAYVHLLHQQGVSTFARALTVGVLLTLMAILVMRIVTTFIWPVGEGVLDTSTHHLIYVTGFSFGIVLLSVSLVLMATERLHAEVAYLASHDSLTNALTRRHMNEVCAMEMERSQRHGHSMALLIMDLDHFKSVNDTYGHQRGDKVLVDFVAKVHALLRRPDQLGRFGGEEFVALLPETSLDEAVGVAERIRAACAASDQDPYRTVSIGVTTNHTAGDSVGSLIARADAAMYQAKAKGRNRVETA
ncbi:MAG: GGDEF domain-containing protein [Rhodoferax sp.]|nr:GGDEF domain-containing protein [Rhodoferax sp.]MDP3654146.1 GGDEF domain-containing protein [Rhodoferax sp.]